MNFVYFVLHDFVDIFYTFCPNEYPFCKKHYLLNEESIHYSFSFTIISPKEYHPKFFVVRNIYISMNLKAL